MTAPLFQHYLAVDWSAAAVPRAGKDSIWIAGYEGGGNCPHQTLLENPKTRAAATARLIGIARESLQAGKRILIGFDFPFGYPAGTAAGLGLAGGLEWRKIWARIDALLADQDDNANNRFQVGAQLNKALSGEAFPFWGCPAGAQGPYLVSRNRRPQGPDDLAERRLVERRVTTTQPVWKLAYTGAVGSQALTGIPRVWQIRTDPDLAFGAQIWPFETGLTLNPAGDLILAEIYPSLVTPDAHPGLPKDAGQVTATARALANADALGQLGALFAGDPSLTPDQRADVEREEAWVLGVTDRPVLADFAKAA
jgi:precorrin-8X/cobalt-precorrin-8 methylmutase